MDIGGRVKKFFAPEARIDPRPGGRYTVIFFPSKDPEGDSHGQKGPESSSSCQIESSPLNRLRRG